MFSTFAAIIAKHVCASQFMLALEQEKKITKCKHNSQHHRHIEVVAKFLFMAQVKYSSLSGIFSTGLLGICQL
jgi:hypothetical protein